MSNAEDRLSRILDKLTEISNALNTMTGAGKDNDEDHDFAWAMHQIQEGCVVCCTNGPTGYFSRSDVAEAGAHEIQLNDAFIKGTIWRIVRGTPTTKPIRNGTFAWAMSKLAAGRQVRRHCYTNGTVFDAFHDKSFILNSDVLATDWEVVEEETEEATEDATAESRNGDFVWAMYQLQNRLPVACCSTGLTYSHTDVCADEHFIEFDDRYINSTWEVRLQYEHPHKVDLKEGTFAWAAQHLANGSSIRRKCWDPAAEFHKGSGNYFWLNKDVFADDWEIVMEKHDVKWAAARLKEGKPVRRRSHDTYVLSPDLIHTMSDDDLLAEDWETA